MSRFSRYGVTTEMISGEFGMALQRLLFEKSNTEQTTQYYKTLLEGLRSPVIENEITYIYNFEMGRFYYNQGKYHEALPFFEGSIKHKASSQDAVNAFIGSLIQVVGNDNIKIITEFKRYGEAYPT